MHDVVEVIRRRTGEIVAALDALGDDELLAPSALPGWSRLTVACHLRYGARALAWMTDAALAGEPASYYPEGRAAQRPGTLHPEPGESPGDVVASLGVHAAELDARWSALAPEQWSLGVVEPADNPDLGNLSLGVFATLRLTEVEVHGTDLDLGLADWDPLLVEVGLDFRLARLHRLLGDRPTVAGWHLTVPATGREVRLPADDGDQVLRLATERDLFALLLGRPLLEPTPDVEEVEAFRSSFPGP